MDEINNGRAYFSQQRALAEEYVRHYREGILEVETPTSVYNSRLRQHEQLYQGGPQVELLIPFQDYIFFDSTIVKRRGTIHDTALITFS